MAIVSFSDHKTQSLWSERKSRHWSAIKDVALRKLEMIEAAHLLDDLRSPPGNRLEALKGDRKGQHSIRIDSQWHICFAWKKDGAHQIEITDYH